MGRNIFETYFHNLLLFFFYQLMRQNARLVRLSWTHVHRIRIIRTKCF